jgi:hypothetical protein
MNKKTHYSIHTYSEYLEFVNNGDKRYGKSSRGTGSDFSGTENYEEAIGLAVNGWDAGLKQLEAEIGTLENNQIEFNQNVVGAAVNIGAYLQGQPENMWEFKENKEYDLEELVVYLNLGYNASMSKAKAMKFTMSMVRLVNKYQSKYNVKIIGCVCSDVQQDGVSEMVSEIIIKDFDQRFVLNNIAFALHPSFFRRLWFSHMEKYSWIPSGYGRNISDKLFKANAVENHAQNGRKMVLAPQLDRKLTDSNNLGGGFDIDKVELINFKS